MADTQANPRPPASSVHLDASGRLLVASALILLGFLWFVLINHLRFEWAVNPQYSFGWAVPFLCAYLGWRAHQKAEILKTVTGQGGMAGTSNLQPSTFNFQQAGRVWPLVVLFCAALYPMTRLVQEANPEWRLVSWALAAIVAGLTLVVVRRVFGSLALRRFAFPILFFLVAVPWPTVIEAPLIQNLARFNASGAVEVLNLIGTPAFRRGNIIEISTGMVGVEEACSGIRSFQSCLMIALFLGAYHRLKISRRMALLVVGFVLAIVFNLGRTVLLVGVASSQGIQAISQWHDPAGITILVGCFLGVWLVSTMFRRRSGLETAGSVSAVSSQPNEGIQTRSACMLSVGLLIWLIVCEAGVELWYRSHEQNLQPKQSWVVKYPEDSAEFKKLPFTPHAVQLLRFDEGQNAVWVDRDGIRCQAIFLRWNPGRIAVHLARSHTPEVCLSSTGYKLTGKPQSRVVSVNGLSLTFDVYHAEGQDLWVYYCLWEDQAKGDSSATEQLSYRNRFQTVLEGRRNLGQRSLEFAVWSAVAEEEVFSRVEERLKDLIQPVGRSEEN